MRVWFCWLSWVWLGFPNLHAQNRFDVLITEIFADPTPPVGLPSPEWIELKNLSAAPINLQGWRLADAAGQSGPFPSFILYPDSNVIVCGNSSQNALQGYGALVAVTSFPTLDNDGDMLLIRSAQNKTIHAVPYLSSWYRNDLKKQGGWSLEMIDPRNPCTGKNNWRASEHPAGGTPGKKNSVHGINPDTEAPRLLRSYAPDSSTIRLVFDEPVDSLAGAGLSNYSINNGLSFSGARTLPPLFNEIELRSTVLLPGVIYTVSAHSVKDCAGNTMDPTELRTGIADYPGSGEWIINEILFNPRPNGYDYVEFLNNSDKIFDLSELLVANRNSSGALSSTQYLSDAPWLVFPGEYIVVTEEAENLSLHYLLSSPRQVIELASLPSYPDDEGSVVSLDSRGIITDELEYDEDWHFRLISNREAVALERIDPHAVTQDRMNWHSASSQAGYGTPGYRNSQYFQLGGQVSTLEAEPRVFSPDNDGRDDVLLIQYELEAVGYLASVTIFDVAGRPVRHLVRNELAGKKGHWKWDGLDNKGRKLPAAIYVVYAELFNLSGKKEIFKKAVVIAAP